MDGSREDERKDAQTGGPGAPGPPAAERPAGARRRYGEQERDALLTELAASGESVGSFARRHGMSPWTIYKWSKSSGATGSKVSKTSLRRRCRTSGIPG